MMGWTALICASSVGHEAVIRVLIGAGANVKQVDFDGSTALREASSGGHEAVVRLLLQAGATVNEPTLLVLRQHEEALRASDPVEALDIELNSDDEDETEEMILARHSGTVATLQVCLTKIFL